MNQKRTADLLEITENLRNWFKSNGYKGIDPYFLDEKGFKLSSKIPIIKVTRQLLKPLHSHINKKLFSSFSPRIIPKALGLIISGNSSLYKVNPMQEYLDENDFLIKLLVDNRNRNFQNYAWGWPFEWGKDVRYPFNYPLAIVTSEIGHAILNYYECKLDEKLLTFSDRIAKFLLFENGYAEKEGAICFYYSSLCRRLVINVNTYVASFLLRLSVYIDNDYGELAKRAIRFTLDKQNEDGSWYYDANIGKSIDNRHTGFTLCALKWSNHLLNQGNIDIAIKRGWDFYRNNMFEGVFPKWSPDTIFPVDVKDVAQAIITSVELGDISFAEKLIDFALENFFNGKDEFYFKLFKNGNVNKTVFFRWSQSWMFRALSLFLERINQGKFNDGNIG